MADRPKQLGAVPPTLPKDVFGSLPYSGPLKTIEEMNLAYIEWRPQPRLSRHLSLEPRSGGMRGSHRL
jgi:hypothetical protein